jgi:hypothetical protein
MSPAGGYVMGFRRRFHGGGGLTFVDSGTPHPGAIYGLHDNNGLLWYEDLFQNGKNAPDGSTGRAAHSGSQIGQGWQDIATAFSDGDGVIYAIHRDGSFLWYQDELRNGANAADGSTCGAQSSGNPIGQGWRTAPLPGPPACDPRARPRAAPGRRARARVLEQAQPQGDRRVPAAAPGVVALCTGLRARRGRVSPPRRDPPQTEALRSAGRRSSIGAGVDRPGNGVRPCSRRPPDMAALGGLPCRRDANGVYPSLPAITRRVLQRLLVALEQPLHSFLDPVTPGPSLFLRGVLGRARPSARRSVCTRVGSPRDGWT